MTIRDGEGQGEEGSPVDIWGVYNQEGIAQGTSGSLEMLF